MKHTGKKQMNTQNNFLAVVTTGLLTASLITTPAASLSTASAASLSTDSAASLSTDSTASLSTNSTASLSTDFTASLSTDSAVFLSTDSTASLSTDSAAPLSEEEATQVALDAAGLQEANVTIHIQRDTDDGLDLYKLKLFTDTQEEYEYEILAETGEILEASWEQWGTADGKGTAISLDDAKQLAADHAGIALEDAIFEKAEEDREGGERIWDLEFFTEEQKEYEYEIMCDTGLILSWSYDGERYLAWKAANPDAAQAQENLQGMGLAQDNTQSLDLAQDNTQGSDPAQDNAQNSDPTQDNTQSSDPAQDNAQSSGLAQDNTQSSDNSSVYYDSHHPEAHHPETHH